MNKKEGNDLIQVTKCHLPDFQDYIDEISDLWKSHHITNSGTKHNELAYELARYLNASTIKLFTNGHLALELVIEALELTGEVITTPFTFISTTNAIVRKGLTPVFCDIRDDDFTMDASKIEALITDKTSAIMPVHVYGNLCDVEAIDKIAKKHGLKVIYDAAHAFGVKLNGRGVSRYGDASMFSFHATKVFHTIEGGAIATEDQALAKKLKYLINFGITGWESTDYVGGNAKMNEFQAAMGLCNLRIIDDLIAKRKEVCGRYDACLKDIPGIRLIHRSERIESNYSYYPVIVEGGMEERDRLFDLLKEQNIYSRKYFYPLTNKMSCFDNNYEHAEVPVAEYISERVLTLPLYAELDLDIVERICSVIREGVTV